MKTTTNPTQLIIIHEVSIPNNNENLLTGAIKVALNVFQYFSKINNSKYFAVIGLNICRQNAININNT